MIAGAAVWVRGPFLVLDSYRFTLIQLRWALSPDEEFTPIGDHTKIDYQSDFETYLEYLTFGLDQGDDDIIRLFKEWDTHFYPHSDESMAEDEVPEVQESRNALMDALRRKK
jgi:hypothetical protein